MSGPHDKLFRRIFDQPARAAELLRTALPTTLVAGLDGSSLQRIPETFLDAALHEHHADLLFEARAGGGHVLVYLLLEHKSAPKPLTPFQILRYIVRIWEEWLRHHHDASRLPPIIPLVVHHGPHPWYGPRRLSECVTLAGVDPDMAATLLTLQPQLEVLIDDLGTASEADIAARAGSALTRVTLLFLARLRQAEPDEVLAAIARWTRLLDELAAAADARATLPALWSYLLEVTDVPAEALRGAVTKAADPELADSIMSTANKLRAEGEAEGEVRGEARGEATGRIKLLLRMLQARFGTLTAEVTERIRSASTDDLDRWGVRLLDASTPDDVFTQD